MVRRALNSKVAKHTALSLGVGAATFLAGAEKLATDPWWQLGCAAGLATLASLGVAYAKRSDP